MKQFLLSFYALLGSSLALAESAHIPGDTPEARVAFLKALPDTPDNALALRRKYLEVAVKDPASEVRSYAAWRLRGNEYIGTLVQVLADDPDPRVRSAAGMSLDHWLTDNGVKTCNGAQQVAQHIEALVRAGRDLSTADAVISIFGFRYSGNMPLPCCMQPQHQERILAALADLANEGGPTSQGLLDQLRHSEHGGNFDYPDKAKMATKRILECTQSS